MRSKFSLDQDPYYYDLEVLQWIGGWLGLRVHYIGDWGNPRYQKMLVLTK
jgi:hypothetical protein